MPIDPSRAEQPNPEVQTFLQLYESMEMPELHELTADLAREIFEQQLAVVEVDEAIATVADGTFDGPAGAVPYRLYDPREDPEGTDPIVLYFHGGGFVVGSLDTHDGPCRKLAAETGYPVCSIDYRLAPEHHFPAAVEDCYAAIEWLAGTATSFDADPQRLVVAGDSAGGNLAASTSLLARDRDGPDIARQVLIYPVTGDARETESYRKNAEGYFLTAETMDWFVDCYFETEIDQGNIYAAPRRAYDLSGLPPATIVTAGYDPLRDDGAAYARRLADADVPIEYRNFDGLIHGFWNMIGGMVDIDKAHTAYEYVAETLETVEPA